jgi:hypothetical protein
MSFLYVPLAVVLGFPMLIGAWLAGVRVFKFVAARSSKKQTAFVVTLCVMAAVLSLLSAPVWLVGYKGYLVSCAVYIAFVAVGAPHVYRTLEFLGLELDGDPDNDVPLPGDADYHGHEHHDKDAHVEPAHADPKETETEPKA